MHSSEEKSRWVVRWKYEMAAEASRPGMWRLREGGFFVRARVMDPRTGKEVDVTRVMRGKGISVHAALRVQDQLRLEGRERVLGRTPSKMHWSEYAASLFEAKVADGTILSAASRRRWADTLARLVPRFGRYYVDDLRPADFVEWRNEIARWILHGMPSRRKRDRGKLVPLSPVTANGWISIWSVACNTPVGTLRRSGVRRRLTRGRRYNQLHAVAQALTPDAQVVTKKAALRRCERRKGSSLGVIGFGS
jgi:hypothetical protein